jgi:glyoxylase-like metal-dependent hydrolase (beta-lactamase superfamily II)
MSRKTVLVALALLIAAAWVTTYLMIRSQPVETNDAPEFSEFNRDPAQARLREWEREWMVSEHLTVRQIHPDVWVHISRQALAGGVLFPANGLLVRDGDGLIMVDTAWGEELTELLLDWVDAELGLPVTGAVATHFHADSLGGSPVLAARGIPIYSSALTRELAREQGIPLPEALADFETGQSLRHGSLEIFYPGRAHSHDNLMVWIEQAGVLFGSCAMRSPEYRGAGNVADADVEEWPQSMRRVLERYGHASTVVPGHGQPGDASLIRHTISVFEDE